MHSCQEKMLTFPLSVLQRQIPEALQNVNNKVKLTGLTAQPSSLVCALNFLQRCEHRVLCFSHSLEKAGETYRSGIFLFPLFPHPPFFFLCCQKMKEEVGE